MSSPRVERRRQAARIAILRAAGRTFRERGFAETSMRDIADGADLSVANLYHHFAGKDQILYFCQDRSLDLMLTAVGEAARLDGSASARLRHVLRAHGQAVLDDVEGAIAHVATDALSPLLRKKIIAKRDRYERAVRGIVNEGVAAGEFAAGDVALRTRAMLGALNWTVTWFKPDGPQQPAEVAASIADFLLGGLATRNL